VPIPFQKQHFTNRFHSLGKDFYTKQAPTPLEKPELVHINPTVAQLLDQNAEQLNNPQFQAFINGQELPAQCQPIASIYAGHQFGHFVPQLGDGRALLLGEIKNSHHEHWEIQLKGSGITPYSRQGDGRAVLRSTIREYLCSEAMHALGIPTTRALAMLNSKEEVHREQLETGASLLRLSPSFIRFGHFELFASRGQVQQVKQLADFVIKHYYPDSLTDNKKLNPYAHFFSQVVQKTARLLAHWQAIGFAHGVMNTDNMSILGLTIDYGPFAFIDRYEHNFICNHSDYQGRYSLQNQASIGHWNLARLAEALLSLISIDEAHTALADYEVHYSQHYLLLMREKLGFYNSNADKQALEDQEKLIFSLLSLMENNQVDYTVFFRQLSNSNTESTLDSLFLNKNDFYSWNKHYTQALFKDSRATNDTIKEEELRLKKMKKVNPKYILRNYMLEIAIQKAQQGDYSEINTLFKLIQSPYDEHLDQEHYAGLPPDWAKHISISCSS